MSWSVSQLDNCVNLDLVKLYSFDEIPVLVKNENLNNEELVLATSLSFSNQNNLRPEYAYNKKTVYRVAPTAPNVTDISIEFYPTFQDVFFKSITEDLPVTLYIGGINIRNGYVNSYSVSVSANNLITCSVDLRFYNFPSDFFNKLKINKDTLIYRDFVEKGKLAHASFSKLDQDLVDIPFSFNYNYTSEIDINLRLGSSVPNEYRFLQKRITCNLNGEIKEKYVTLYGEKASVKINLYDACNYKVNQKFYKDFVQGYHSGSQSYEIDGQITSSNFEISQDQVIKGNLQLIQFI